MEYPSFLDKRFLAAMCVYAAMAGLAAVTLDGKMRIAIWILMGGLALKTLIAHAAGRGRE